MTLAHLEHLHDTLQAPDGTSLDIWWIYAKPTTPFRRRPPTETNYDRFHASSEGIACVDDVARVAIVYLNHHEIHGDDHSLDRARQALEFIQYMQVDDGRFLNFVVDPEMSETVFGEPDPDIVDGVRVDGSPTSEPSHGWWATRACWALGQGYLTLADLDTAFAEELAECIHSYLDVVDEESLSQYGEYAGAGEIEQPEWLIEDTYATAPAVLGLASYYRASGDERIEDRLRKLADGIRDSRRGDAITPPFGAHLDTSPGSAWHTWGLRQAAALARAGAVLDGESYVDSARREIAALHSHHAASYNQLGSFGPAPLPYHQLSYGTDALVQGCTELWKATGERGFARLGGQLASWYLGNNIANVRMWDPDAGRGYDGIYQDTIDWKSGAESTIAAARTALDVERYPPSARFSGNCTLHDGRRFTTVTATDGDIDAQATRLVTDTGESLLAGGEIVRIFEGGAVTMEPELEAGTYRPYLVHEQTIAPDATAIVRIGDSVQTIDIGGSSEAHFEMTALDPLEIGEDATVEVSYEGANDRSAKVDAVVFQPGVEYRVIETENGAGAVARSFVDEQRTETVPMPIGDGWKMEVRTFDEQGRVTRQTEDRSEAVGVCELPVEPRGFSIAQANAPEPPSQGSADRPETE
jgi:hypothetical protein